MSATAEAIPEGLERRIGALERWRYRFRASVVVELLTPLHIGTGDEKDESDAGVVFDANGLATIPGSSLKGVLRSEFERAAKGTYKTSTLFGYQENESGQGARVLVTWGRVHNRNNQPIRGLIDPDALETDEVLASAAAPELRDHVRIDEKGVAKDKSKFDEVSVIAGHRFSFGIEMISDNSETDRGAWRLLVALLKRDALRLGGKTRRGFGAVKLVSLDADPEPAEPMELPPRYELLHKLDLAPDDDCFWMVGGGADLVADDEAGTADDAPLRASRVVWEGQGRVERDCFVIPGTAVKGPLSHRTHYHLCRRLGVWHDSDEFEKARVRQALSLLFGHVNLDGDSVERGSRTAPKAVAQAGRLFIDDVYLDNAGNAPQAAADMQNHVTVDRALGGALEHHLFTDRPLAGGQFPLAILYDPPSDETLDEGEAELISHVRAALGEAVEELGDGMLALGAHANRGYGWFRTID